MNYEEIARMAMAFVLEYESWPKFIEWVKETHESTEAHLFADEADIVNARRQWLMASPDLELRRLAELPFMNGGPPRRG